MTKAGFTILGKEHPISPVFLGEETIAQEMASRMLDEGIYVIPFSYPVVAKVIKCSANRFQSNFREKLESESKFLPLILTNKFTKQLLHSQNALAIWESLLRIKVYLHKGWNTVWDVKLEVVSRSNKFHQSLSFGMFSRSNHEFDDWVLIGGNAWSVSLVVNFSADCMLSVVAN